MIVTAVEGRKVVQRDDLNSDPVDARGCWQKLACIMVAQEQSKSNQAFNFLSFEVKGTLYSTIFGVLLQFLKCYFLAKYLYHFLLL
jgi:hypothetical protein